MWSDCRTHWNRFDSDRPQDEKPRPQQPKENVMSKFEHLNAVRIDEVSERGVFMTRFGTRHDHPLLAERGPLTLSMLPGQVWRLRWRSADFHGEPERVVLIDARPILSAWPD
jgi:hypothetical protein